jgi:hypothetical protein
MLPTLIKNVSAGMAKTISAAKKKCFALLVKRNILDSISSKKTK